jgi:hypothetical protein
MIVLIGVLYAVVASPLARAEDDNLSSADTGSNFPWRTR